MENTGRLYDSSEGEVGKLLQQPEYADVHYHSIYSWGNKVAAEYLGAILAKQHDFKYVMAIDDDVEMPDGFDPQIELLKGDFKMIAYPIKPANNTNYLTHMQKREYRRSDRHNYFKQVLGTVLAPHGAVNLSEIDAYLENMRMPPNDGAFSAEDQKKGNSWRRSNHKIAMAAGPEVETEVPEDLAVFWAQRVKSWDTGAHLTTPMYVADALLNCPRCWECETIIGNSILEAYKVQAVFANVSDCVRPYILWTFVRQPMFWIISGGIWEFNNIINMADDIYFTPLRSRIPECDGKKIATTCVDHHLSFPYSTMQLVNGSCSAACAWLGAGAATAEITVLSRNFRRKW